MALLSDNDKSTTSTLLLIKATGNQATLSAVRHHGSHHVLHEYQGAAIRAHRYAEVVRADSVQQLYRAVSAMRPQGFAEVSE
jgi:hypothetical protein